MTAGRARPLRVFVAGHRGMVGAALLRALEPLGAELVTRSSAELDLRNQAATDEFFAAERPEIVLFAAAKVGGIQANVAAPADFLDENLAMTTHTIRAAHEWGAKRLVFLASIFAGGTAHAQIVNVQSALAEPPQDGLSGAVEASVDWRTGNTRLLRLAGSTVLRFHRGDSTALLLARGDYGRAGQPSQRFL